MRSRLKRYWVILLEEFALFSLEFFIVLALGLTAIYTFINLAGKLIDNDLQGMDDYLTAEVKSWTSDSMTTFMKTVTMFSNAELVIIPFFIIFIYFLFIKPHRWFRIKVPVVALGSITMNLFLKRVYDRPRPVLEHLVDVTGLSFPSGHAMFSLSFYGLLIYIVWAFVTNRILRVSLTILLISLILCIGISRVYLGVHFPSDVIAGFAAGLAWLVISIWVIRRIEAYITKKEKQSLHPQ